MSEHGHENPGDRLLHDIEHTSSPAHLSAEYVEEAEAGIQHAKAVNEAKEAGKEAPALEEHGHGDHAQGQHAPHVSYLPMEAERTLPPNLRQFTRYEYAIEYVEWWKQGITSKVQTILFFGLGLLTLETFPPGALLMFILAGRHKDLAWMYDFIAKKFGMSRTITLVD
ncbi:MAG: hypothetical protein Q8P02_02085 [Candidatus Micrarchaeota archaeon]|nr:hypothetical protein [Candidatus Micrarchaeota archaeon]